LTDLRTPATGGGLQKWQLGPSADGGSPTWTLVRTFNLDTTGTMLSVGIRHVMGMVTGNSVTLIVTTGEGGSSATAPTRLLRYVDDGTPNPTPTLLSTATVKKTIYRGLSFAP
jgi:hypothetical protein